MPTVERAARTTLCSYLGRVSYTEAVALQERLRGALLSGDGPEALLLLEHPHVFTLGRNAPPADVKASVAWLEARHVEVHPCDRGGRVTYHGPGQLVGYPILDLSPDRRDVRRYVRDLQEVLVRTLADLGLVARGGDSAHGIGVWVGTKKVASIGVHLRRWVTTHGFALNVTTDLSYFAGIEPCGFDASVMASVESLCGARPDLSDVAASCAAHFATVFERNLVWNRSAIAGG